MSSVHVPDNRAVLCNDYYESTEVLISDKCYETVTSQYYYLSVAQIEHTIFISLNKLMG